MSVTRTAKRAKRKAEMKERIAAQLRRYSRGGWRVIR